MTKLISNATPLININCSFIKSDLISLKMFQILYKVKIVPMKGGSGASCFNVLICISQRSAPSLMIIPWKVRRPLFWYLILNIVFVLNSQCSVPSLMIILRRLEDKKVFKAFVVFVFLESFRIKFTMQFVEDFIVLPSKKAFLIHNVRHSPKDNIYTG